MRARHARGNRALISFSLALMASLSGVLLGPGSTTRLPHAPAVRIAFAWLGRPLDPARCPEISCRDRLGRAGELNETLEHNHGSRHGE